MKVKGIISTVLAAAMVAGTGVTVFAEGAYVSSANDKEIVVTSDTDMKVRTVVADYDVNGRFVNAFTKLIDVANGDSTYTYADLGVSGISSERKVMLWKGEEDSIEPINATEAASEITVDASQYLVAYVDEVELTDKYRYIWFGASSGDASELEIVEEKTYNFTLDGKSISVEDIKEGDVLTIRCGEDEWLEDLEYYDITVSRDRVDGQVVAYDEENGIYTLEDGRSYKDMGMIRKGLKLGTNYRLYFDAFGRIAYAEEIIDYGMFGIVEDVYAEDGVYSADIIDTEGVKTNYTVTEEDYEELKDTVYFVSSKEFVTSRVISYKISDDGAFALNRIFSLVTGYVVDYDSETTTVLNNAKKLMFHDYDTVTPAYKSDLEDGQQYKIWCYGQDIDGRYEVVLLHKVEKVSLDSPMAICASEVSESKGKYTIKAYADGKLSTFTVENEAVAQALNVGDAFFYAKNDDDIITGVTPVLKNSMTTYADLYNAAIENKLDMIDDTVTENLPEENEVVFGIITEFNNYTSDTVVLATKDTIKDITSVDVYSHTDEYNVSDAVVVYQYDYDEEVPLSKEKVTAMVHRNLPNSAYDDNGRVDFTKSLFLSEENPNYGRVKLALLRLVDDEIVEAYVIVPSSTK